METSMSMCEQCETLTTERDQLQQQVDGLRRQMQVLGGAIVDLANNEDDGN